MSLRGAISGTVRALLLATATGAATLGLLAVFHPFSLDAPAIVTTDNGAEAMRQKIEAAREALRQTEAALAGVNGQPTDAGLPPGGDAQLDVQIAATIERRDLAQRHARAIRDAVDAGSDLGGLAEIRDSVVVGQLLAQQSALDAQIAEQGARLKANHPTMRALRARRAALEVQIKSEAAGIAAALESEATLDDAQLKQLQLRTEGVAVTAPDTAADASSLQARAATQRAELDSLVDTYFGLETGASPSMLSPSILLNPLNLFVVAIASAAAIVFQIGLALRRRRVARDSADIALWRRDHDPELVAQPTPAGARQSVLRRAS